jgi:hypothetical protein
MNTPDRKAFLDWYQTVKDNTFDFKKEILSYCQSDVAILRQACLKFRDLMIPHTGVDPFNRMTIASACMSIFRTNFLEEGKIAQLANKSDNFSHASICWLKWVERQDGLHLQHALSLEGEYHIPGTDFKADGYDSSSRTVYEFNGCFWHGCPKCFPDRELEDPRTKEPLGVRYA